MSTEVKTLPVLAFLAGSLLLHALLLVTVSHRVAPPPLPQRPGELVEIEVARPPPPPPPVPVVKPPLRVKPPAVHVAVVNKAPPPKTDAPPPPNETPQEPPRAPPPLVVGVTLSSTTTAGSFAAPVGNTAYGKMASQAQPPGTAKPYSAPRYAPLSEVDAQPELISEFKPPYPEDARRAGVEGRVTLQITIDESGNVTTAKVIQGVGHGLDEAARDGMLKARFRPATRAGSAVATMLTFVYRFELP